MEELRLGEVRGCKGEGRLGIFGERGRKEPHKESVKKGSISIKTEGKRKTRMGKG